MDLIEEKQNMSRMTNPVFFGNQFRQFMFYKAFVLSKRIAGTCDLVILWKSGRYKKKLIVHYLRLAFNHEGVKEYLIEIVDNQDIGALKTKLQEYVSINLQEAASLIQDAYMQNIRFKTNPAQELEEHKFMLEYNISNQNRISLKNRLIQEGLTVHEFTNIYLAAIRRMDNGLLYDCTSTPRQEILGDRNAFIINNGEEYRGYTFLRTGIRDISIRGNIYMIDAFATVITDKEEIVKIGYSMSVKEEEDQYSVNSFFETGREILNSCHPENPFNYSTYCTIYEFLDDGEIKNWLANEPEVFVTGELEDCIIYKWLKDTVDPRKEFNINDKIIMEFVLKKDELIIFAKKPYNLIKVEKKAAEYAATGLKLHKKYYLPVKKLYQYIFLDCLDKGQNSKNRKQLQQYSGYSALIYLKDNSGLLEYLQKRSEGQVSLGTQITYFFGGRTVGDNKIPCIKEYYSSKNWLKIYTYGEEQDKEIEDLKIDFEVRDIVYDFELENYYDLFNPPVSEQRKWYIYGLLQRFYHDKNNLYRYGVVPALEDVLRVLGAVKTG